MSHGIGSQVQRPLAVVIVGGMLVGPVMLLLVAPALQVLLMSFQAEKLRYAYAAKAPEDEEDDL
jgi:cobalt-zinc-cadmium resistance protein CzcA